MNIADKLITIADNTSAVAEAVNASKATKVGSVFSVDDVLNVGKPLPVQLKSKNLIATSSVDAEADKNKVLFEGNITGDFVFSCLFNYSEIKTPTAAQFEFVVDGATVYQARGSTDKISKKLSGTLTKITFINWGYGVGTVENLQLEVGSTATKYTPYIEDLADKEVKIYGKNLFNYQWPFKNGASKIVSQIDGVIEVKQDSAKKWCSANIVLPSCYDLVGKTITISGKVKTEGGNNACIRVMWLTNAAGGGGQSFLSKYISSADYVSFTKTGTVPEQPSEEHCNLCLMLYSNIDATITAGQTNTAWYKDLQIEIGSATTDYEAYSEQTGTADADGKVTGLVALSPMLIVADDDTGAEVKYFPTSAAETIAKYNEILQAENDLKAIL